MEGYGDICADFYDLDKPNAPALALEWFAAELEPVRQVRGTARILEPMCGSGRFLLPLLRRGLRVDGADPSPAMLRRCRDRLSGETGLAYQAELFAQSMQELETAGDYAAAFIPSGSFCLLHQPAEAQAGLQRLRAQLAPGALLLIEFELPHSEIDWPEEVVKTVTKGGRQIRLVSRASYDFATQIESYDNAYELKQSGKVIASESEVIRLRCYTPDQISKVLAQAGFRDIRIEHPAFGWVAIARASGEK